MEEIFDVVDESDLVIGQAPRSEVHANGLLHRAVHTFVFNSAGKLLLQLRSASKDEYPLQLTSSASGHLHRGESYDAAAERELEEELGLQCPLEFLWKFQAGPSTANEHTALYRTTTDATPEVNRDEIAECRFLTLDEIRRQMERAPEQFAPPFRVLFYWYCRNHAADPMPAG